MIVLSASNVQRNRAGDSDSATSSLAAGGAFYILTGVKVAMETSNLDGNRADGMQAQGGAVWSSTDALTITKASIRNNGAYAYGSLLKALGGAFFLQAGSAELVDTQLESNRAEMASKSAQTASGGAIYVDSSAKAKLVRSHLRHNAAGGQGAFQISWQMALQLAEERASSAMHIFSKGGLVLDGCSMTDDKGLALFAKEYMSMWYWIVSEGGTVELYDSRFETSATHLFDPFMYADDRSCQTSDFCINGGDYKDCNTTAPADSGPFGLLLNVRSDKSEVVIRGCTAKNLDVRATATIQVPLGILNTTFTPPISLNASLTVLPAIRVDSCGKTNANPLPNCGAKVAGSNLCDPKARCEPVSSGGVLCSCKGSGLYVNEGMPADGRACEQKECGSGLYLVEGVRGDWRCEKCGKGAYSEGKTTTACQLCQPGALCFARAGEPWI